MALFQPDFGLMFWMLVVFLIILGILAKYAWPVIIRSIEQRAEFIDQGVEDAREAKRQLEDARAKIGQMMAEAHKRQLESLQETERMKRDMIEEARKEASEEARKMMEEAKVSIKQAEHQAQLQIRQQVSRLSLEVAGKILRKNLSDDAGQEELINKMLDELEDKK